MTSPLSPRLHELLEASLDSFEKLEVVLTLRAVERPMSVAELARELQVGTDALQRVVDGVVTTGVVARAEDDLVTLRAGSWTVLIDEAAALHRRAPQQLRSVFDRIAREKIRERSSRSSATAFRLRKTDANGKGS